jgi:hypothetical protein
MSGLATSGVSRLDVARARWLLSHCTVNCRLTPRTPRTVPVSRPVQSIELPRMRVGQLRAVDVWSVKHARFPLASAPDHAGPTYNLAYP